MIGTDDDDDDVNRPTSDRERHSLAKADLWRKIRCVLKYQ